MFYSQESTYLLFFCGAYHCDMYHENITKYESRILNHLVLKNTKILKILHPMSITYF